MWNQRESPSRVEKRFEFAEYSEISKFMKMVDQFKENIRSKKDFVSLLNEEILAWNIGKSLAFQLGHDINCDKYNKTKKKHTTKQKQ